MSPRQLYRPLAIAEAVTWTLLIAGMVMKYVLLAGDLGVQVGGLLHGIVFVAYVVVAVLVAVNQRWSARLTALAIVAAVIPWATIPLDRWLERNGRLDGDWRRASTDDLRDNSWFDRLFRWMIARPLLLGAVLVVAVALVVTGLLVIGPPGGRPEA